jgi:hypothetical protein
MVMGLVTMTRKLTMTDEGVEKVCTMTKVDGMQML